MTAKKIIFDQIFIQEHALYLVLEHFDLQSCTLPTKANKIMGGHIIGKHINNISTDIKYRGYDLT